MVGLALQQPNKSMPYSSGDANAPRTNAVPVNDAPTDALHHYLKGLWADALHAKQPVEQEMFRALRQRNGEYEPSVLAQLQRVQGTDLFFKLTETKCRGARAWLSDVIKNSGSRPWGIEPTPVPELSEGVKQRMTMAAQTLIQEGWHPEEVMKLMQDGSVEEEILQEIQAEAKKKSEKMADTIDDQLTEGSFWPKLDEAIDDFVTFPAAFMLGPVTEKSKQLVWKNAEAVIESKLRTTWRRISPFDIYPAPNATCVNDGYQFIHERFTQDDLHQMLGLPGVDDEKLTYILREHGQGGLRGWIDSINDTQREQLEGRYYQQFAKENNIDVLRYYGTVQSSILAEWGMEGFSDRNDVTPVQVEALMIGRYVIRVRMNPNPLGRKPIFKACALPKPGSYWGTAFPAMMDDLQDLINFAVRALAENMSMASGPMVAIDEAQLARGENPDQIYAWKTWHLNTEDAGERGGGLPIEFFQPDMNAQQLQGIINWASLMADNVTGVPAYVAGNEQGAQGGAADTASGLSMLMSANAKGMREMLSEMGDMVREMIEQMYTYNMLYHPDKSIKGDAKVKASGFIAALQRETMQMRMQEFLNMTNNPVDLMLTGEDGRRKVLREVASGLDMDADEVVPKAQKVLSSQQQQIDPATGQPVDPAMGAMPAGPMPGQGPAPGAGARTTDGMAA